MNELEKKLLREIAELDSLPVGAYNIRKDGATAERSTTANIDIVTKSDKDGIDITVKSGTKNESLHIPVIMLASGVKETVYNDIYVGDDCNITVVAGCGIHNSGCGDSAHDGIHRFFIGKNSTVRYVEKHYGSGDGEGKRIMNPVTVAELAEGARFEIESTQIGGVDDTERETKVKLDKGATLTVKEKIMTENDQRATTAFTVDLNGDGSSAHVVSRSVARDESVQRFKSTVNGNAACIGHTECDAIIMDNAKVYAVPEVIAANVNAELIHEAAIGKIAGEQLIKLMTLGLSEKEAEEQIINGFLE